MSHLLCLEDTPLWGQSPAQRLGASLGGPGASLNTHTFRTTFPRARPSALGPGQLCSKGSPGTHSPRPWSVQRPPASPLPSSVHPHWAARELGQHRSQATARSCSEASKPLPGPWNQTQVLLSPPGLGHHLPALLLVPSSPEHTQQLLVSRALQASTDGAAIPLFLCTVRSCSGSTLLPAP